VKTKIKVSKTSVGSRGVKKRIINAVSPILLAVASNSSGTSRGSQYENSALRLNNGTIKESESIESGIFLINTPALTDDFLSRTPVNCSRNPVKEEKEAVIIMLSEINLPKRRFASSDEIMFLFMKDRYGEAYARYIADAMGLEVTPELNALDPSPFAF